MNTPNPITKASSSDAGCWVDGHWGQHAVAHLVDKANDWGYADAEVVSLALRHLASMGPNADEGLDTDEYWELVDASDDVEAWLNDNIAPEGYSFGWNDGEFYLWSDMQWCDHESGFPCGDCGATNEDEVSS